MSEVKANKMTPFRDVISGASSRANRLGERSENKLQDLLRQREEEKKKIFQSRYKVNK